MSDSDSDSDDSLLAAPTFSAKRKRVEERHVQNGFGIMEDALRHMDRMTQQDDRIEKMKLETPDDNDEELFARVEEEIANAASASGGNRRQDLMIGIKEDEDGVLGCDRRMALTVAVDTAQSSCLGVRQTISFTSRHFDAERSEAAHIKNLKECCLQPVQGNQSKNPKILKAAFINPLLKAIKFGVLDEFLKCNRLAELRTEHNVTAVPSEITLWLYRAACSGESPISRGAYESLTALWKQDSRGLLHEPTMTLYQMNTHLQSWVQSCSDEADQIENKENKCESSGCQEDVVPVNHNYCGLANFLRLWTTAFRTGQVPSTNKNDKTVVATLEDGSNAIVALIRMGLDVSFHSAKQTYGLSVALQDLLCEIINFVADDVCKNEDQLVKWMEGLSEKAVNACRKLGPGAPDTDDFCDDKAWLCLFLAAYMLPTKDCKFVCSKNASRFKAILSMRALQICTGIEEAWEKEVCSILAKTQFSDLTAKARVSTAWLAILSSYAALVEIDLQGDTIAMDGPRCLAVVELASCSLDAGLVLSRELTPSSSKTDCEYGTRDEADAHSRILQLLADKSSHLAVRMNKVSTNAFFRRVSYRLNCSHKYYAPMMEYAKCHAGTQEMQVVQTDLDGWFSPETKHDPGNTKSS